MMAEAEAVRRRREKAVEDERRRRRAEIVALLASVLQSVPVRVAASGRMHFRPSSRRSLANRVAAAVRSTLSKTWRRFVARRTRGDRRARPETKPIESDHAEAVRAAVRFARRVGLRIPPQRELRTLTRAMIRDMTWNVRKLIEREALSAAEVVTRVVGSGDPVSDARRIVTAWNMRGDHWRLAIASHVTASVRAALAATDADRFVVLVPRSKIGRVRPSGATGTHLFGVFTRAELDSIFRRVNAGRASRHASSWRNLGLHHGSGEYYVPVPRDMDIESLGSLLQERRSSWLRRHDG